MDLVFEYSHALSPEFCKQIVDQFNAETRVKTFPSESFIHVSRFLEWDNVMKELKQKLPEFIEIFRRHWLSKWPEQQFNYNIINDDSIFVRKLNTQGGIWECPYYVENELERFIAFFVYLSDEGETDFIHKKVKAKTGKLVIFPATWHDVYTHINCENRYMLTGFFYRLLPKC
jgi:hypothetical protein